MYVLPPKFEKKPPAGLSLFSDVLVLPLLPEKENTGASFLSSVFSLFLAKPPPKLKTGAAFFSSFGAELPNENDGLAGSSFVSGDFGADLATGGGGVGDLAGGGADLSEGTTSASTHVVPYI